MFRSLLFACAILCIASCSKQSKKTRTQDEAATLASKLQLNLDRANALASLPLECMDQEFPNKTGHVLGSGDDLAEPKDLHPAFYGCFDWHSAVHGHWSLVRLLKEYPNLNEAEIIRKQLLRHISKENIAKEVAYFEGELHKTFERTYGWAWLLKLAEELHSWQDTIAMELSYNLAPLADLISRKYIEFLPKLQYPIRVGTHSNTAFGLAFAHDYAKTMGNTKLQEAIEQRAKDFYLHDLACPFTWEPSGYDFLSPCLEEIDLMRRVLPRRDFLSWLYKFAPQMARKDFDLEVGKTGDRKDGHLVHLDGLNFSRAWVLYGLANQYPQYKHLAKLADKHVDHTLPNLIGDSYEGGHWLGSFAIYALDQKGN